MNLQWDNEKKEIFQNRGFLGSQRSFGEMILPKLCYKYKATVSTKTYKQDREASKYRGIWDALRFLASFVPLKKREKHPSRTVTFNKVTGWRLDGCFNIPQWVYFLVFLNCTNATKLRKEPPIDHIYLVFILIIVFVVNWWWVEHFIFSSRLFAANQFFQWHFSRQRQKNVDMKINLMYLQLSY